MNMNDHKNNSSPPHKGAGIPNSILNDFKRLTTPISDLIGHDGLETVLDTLFKISRGNFPYFLKLIENIRPIVQQLYDQGQKEQVVDVFGIAGKLADIHPAPATALLNKSPDIINLTDMEGLEHLSDISGKIALTAFDSATRFIEKSPFLIQAILEKADPTLLFQILYLSNAVADKKWQTAIEIVENTPDLIERLSAAGQPDTPEKIYALVNQTAQNYPRIAISLIKNCADIIEKTDAQTYLKIIDSILLVASVNEASSIQLIHKSAGTIERLLNHGDTEMVIAVYDLVAKTAEADDAIAVALWENSSQWIGTAGFESLKTAAELSCKIGGSSHRAALAFMETGPQLAKRIGVDDLEKTAALFSELGNVCDATAEQLCRNSPGILDNASYEGLKDVADFCAYLSKDGPSLAHGVIQHHSEWMNKLLNQADRHHIQSIYQLLKNMAQQNPRIAIAMMETIPDLLVRVRMEQLESISSLALHTAGQSWTTAVSFIKIMPAIIDLLGFDTLSNIAELSVTLSKKNVYSAITTLDKLPSVVDSMIQTTDRSTAVAALDIISTISAENPDVFSSVFENCPSLLKQIGLPGVNRLTELSSSISKISPDTAGQFLKSSPDIIDRTGLNSLTVLSDFYKHIAKEDPKLSADLLRKTPNIISRLLESSDKKIVMIIFNLVHQIAKDNVQMSVVLFEKSPDYVNASGYEGLQMIAKQAMALAEMNNKKAIQFARGESIEFADFMENIPQGIHLEQIKPVLSNYLMALMGRRINIEAGEKSNTDGRKITLPKRVREFQEDDLNFIFYKVKATHLEAHLEFGTFEFDINDVEDLVQSLQARYGNEVLPKGSDLDRFYPLFPEPQLIRDLIHVLEDFRIETRLKNEYPVLGEHIMFIHNHLIKKKPSVHKIKNEKQKAIERIKQNLLAHQQTNKLSDMDRVILQAAKHEAAALKSQDTTIYHTVRAASALYDVIHHAITEPYRSVQKASEALNQSKVLKNIGSFGKTSKQIFEQLNDNQNNPRSGSEDDRSKETSQPSSDAQPSRNLPRTDEDVQLGAQKNMSPRSMENDDPDGHQGHAGGEERYDEESAPNSTMKFSSSARIEKLLKDLFNENRITPAEIEKKTKHMKADQLELFLNHLESTVPIKEELEKEKGTRLYPEWGSDISGYRNNWSRIRKQNLSGTSNEFYNDTITQHSGLLKKVRREFQMIRPEDMTRKNKQIDGEDIDLDAAVEYIIDHKLGLSPSENNYQRIVKNRRDVATLMLIDMSKSTKGNTIYFEKQALIIMAEALKEVGDAFAIYGFSGDNRDNVDFYTIKEFEEPYSKEITQRVSAIDHRFENRDGTALRHAINIMKTRDERTKLIILLSDGKPVDKDYSGNYAIEDTRMALIEAQKNGIHTFCVTVDKDAAKYLPRMYSHSNWAVINDVNKLPEKMYGIYSRLTH